MTGLKILPAIIVAQRRHIMSKTVLPAFAGALASFAIASHAAADSIPYPDAGTYNAATYKFTATSSGDLVAYFAGSGASYDNELGVLVNGVAQMGFGLDNHASTIGDSYNFGFVTAGSSLIFVLQNNTLGKDAYSDPALNVAYDSPEDTLGHNHVYSTAYTATGPIFPGVPVGTYVGFEDLPIPGADFNYSDETFVFTNTTVSPISGVPEPSTWLLMLAGIGGVGLMLRRAKHKMGRLLNDSFVA
jgi:hypothetical protein